MNKLTADDFILAYNQTNYPLVACLIEIEYGIEDKAVIQFENKVRKYKLYTTKKGRTFFRKGRFKFFMDEFIVIK
jgi:hypothetical protein